MEQPSHFFRVGKVKSVKGGLLAALKHNKRTLPESDTANSANNFALAGDKRPEELYEEVKMRMAEYGITKLRKNAVEAIEVIFSLPSNRLGKDHGNFFLDCMEWTKQNFKGWLISFDIHLDEGAPHAHALILPLVEGRMIGSDMVGYKGNLERLRKSFHGNVGCYYGLARFDGRKLSQSEKLALSEKIFDAIKDDSVMLSSVWPVIKELIRFKPELFAEVLSLKVDLPLPNKSFAQIMTAKGRGKRFEPNPMYREFQVNG